MSHDITHFHQRTLESVRQDPDAGEWVGIFFGELTLQISSPWRLISGRQVIVGWEDHGQWFGMGHPVDLPQRVREVTGNGITRSATHDSVGDLAIHFENWSTIQVFNGSAEYEG